MIHTSCRETIHDLGNDSHSVLILSIHSYTIHKGRFLCLGFGKFHFPEMVPPACKADQCDRYFAGPHPFKKRYNGLFNQTAGEGWIPFVSFNAIVPGRYGSNLGGTIFKFIIQNSNLIAPSLWDCSQMNITEPRSWEANIGSGNALMPSNNKPLSEPTRTRIYVTICLHLAAIS